VTSSNGSFQVDYYGQDSLTFQNLHDGNIRLFFETLAKHRIGRKQLKYLLRTNSEIDIQIMEKTGIMLKDSLYRFIAGITGVDNNQSNQLIPEYYQPFFWWKDSNYVYKQNSIIFFTGFLENTQINCGEMDTKNTYIIDWKSNKMIRSFSMDTIQVEQFMNPEMLYQNKIELFFFGGIHEIEHLRPENIKIQLINGDVEKQPMKLERRAFRRRNKITP
jgi:hypothetical protein